MQKFPPKKVKLEIYILIYILIFLSNIEEIIFCKDHRDFMFLSEIKPNQLQSVVKIPHLPSKASKLSIPRPKNGNNTKKNELK